MCSHKSIPPGVNPSDDHLQPTRPGAALLRRGSVRFPGGPDIVAAKVNHFGFAGRSCKQSVHRIANWSGTPLRNHKAIASSKLNQVCVHGEPYNSSGPLFAPSVVRGHDELTKRQGSFPAIGLHGLKCKPERRAGDMGCSPHGRFSWIRPRPSVSGLEECPKNAEPQSEIIIVANQLLTAGLASLAAVQAARGDCRPHAVRLPPFPATGSCRKVSSTRLPVAATGFGSVPAPAIFRRP